MTITERVPDRRVCPDRRLNGRSALQKRLRAALDNGEIEVLFQPQFAARDGALISAEALARWPGQLFEGELFELAANCGMAQVLSLYVARKALAEAALWPADLGLSINITAIDLTGGDYVETMSNAVEEAGLAFERLTLELTEQSLVLDLPESARRLAALAERGARIAIDDFGTGYCNFGYLKHLPLNCMKIDRSIVEGIGENSRDLEVFRGVVAMARALGIDVVAEGVETESQRAAVAREGCVAWQGFLGAEAMTGPEFRAFARDFPAR